ncbi:OB-fold domain-containing protein [Sphingomonas sp. 1P06PA]|uniref:Zn-ribbon domain-containing OB-fold protein n=1 Tax=Sphingomonas sp. 1P06PA TaxID=554121 RepID=UPI0039A77A5B
MTGATRRPVVKGLFQTDDVAQTRLVGTRCTACDTLYFPQAISCRNPDCVDKSIEPVLLPATGIVHSFTIQRYPPPPAFRIDDWAPYAILLVDLGEGLQVMGMMREGNFENLAIGMPVRVIEAALYADAGDEVTTYMFAPIETI